MRTFLSLILIYFFAGCINDKKIPGDIIPQEKMHKMMWDLMRADAYVSDLFSRDSAIDQKKESVKLYEQIFLMYSTTQETFKKSLSFYEGRPDLLKPITDSLRAEEKKLLEKQSEPQTPLPDSSIRKIKLSGKLVPNKE